MSPLLDTEEARARGGFEFKYAGRKNVFSKAHAQLEKQGHIRIDDSVPDFIAGTIAS